METFIVNMYNEGYEAGKKAAEPRIRASDIAEAIMEVKGVAQKKQLPISSVTILLVFPIFSLLSTVSGSNSLLNC